MRTITTARLILRPWEPDGVDFLLNLEGRWDVVRYLGADPSTLDSRDDALASIGRRRRISDHPIHGIWIITDTLARGQRRIIAVTHPDNAASRALCRRVGMRHLGQTTRCMDTDCELFEIKPATI